MEFWTLGLMGASSLRSTSVGRHVVQMSLGRGECCKGSHFRGGHRPDIRRTVLSIRPISAIVASSRPLIACHHVECSSPMPVVVEKMNNYRSDWLRCHNFSRDGNADTFSFAMVDEEKRGEGRRW